VKAEAITAANEALDAAPPAVKAHLDQAAAAVRATFDANGIPVTTESIDAYVLGIAAGALGMRAASLVGASAMQLRASIEKDVRP
jgi:hypothetical protein